MGTIVDYDAAEERDVASGVSLAALIDRQSTEMHATLLRVAPGARSSPCRAAVPP